MNKPKTENSLIPESMARFYRRMAKAFRSPPPKESVAIAGLSRIVELHHCAAATIRAAVELSDTDEQELLQDLCSKEIRLAHAAGELIIELGGSPPRSEESSLELPHKASEMSDTRNQAELMRFVQEDLEYVSDVHRELASSPDIPLEIQQRLDALCSAM